MRTHTQGFSPQHKGLVLMAALLGLVLLLLLLPSIEGSTPALPVSPKDNAGNWEFVTYINNNNNQYSKGKNVKTDCYDYGKCEPETPNIPGSDCPQQIRDPSFEEFQGTIQSPWMQSTLRFGTHLICSPGLQGCPTLTPVDGRWFARFPENDISSIRQSIFLGDCELIQLSFWIWVPFNACLRSVLSFQVRIDNQVLFMISTPQQAEQYQSGWTQIRLTVPNSFADQTAHTLIFEANTLNLLDITILLDLIQFIFVDCPDCTSSVPSIPQIQTPTISQIPTPTISFICIPGSQCITLVIAEVGRTTAIRVCFVGRVGRTWTYQVRELSGRGIQLISLGIGTCVTNVVSAFPSGAQIGVNQQFNFLGIQWHLDQAFTSGFFSFTLDYDAAETSIPVLAQAFTGSSSAPSATVEGLLGPDCSGMCTTVTGGGIGIIGEDTNGEHLNGAMAAFGTTSIATTLFLCLCALLFFFLH